MRADHANPHPADAGRQSAERPPGTRIDGWKAIAGHLHRDIRTVQRWELTEQLPIHRQEHGQRATAYALTDELDQWMANRIRREHDQEIAEARPTPFRRRAFVAVAALVALAALGSILWWWLWRAPSSSSQHLDTRSAEAYAAFAEGRALYASRQYTDAAAALERAVARDADYGAAWALLAKTYGRQAQPVWSGGKQASERATRAAERAERLAPNAPETHVGKAMAARARGDVATWRAAANRALELDPRAAEALALLGDSYSAVVYACNRDEDPERAETYYRRAMELMPNSTTTASNRAGNLRRLGRYGECVDLLNTAIRAFHDETPLLAVRGGCRLMLGDIAGATADIAPLRDNPKIAHAGSFVYLGLLELKSGRVEQGIRDLEAIPALDGSARAELIVAEAYGAVGDVARATAHLEKALALDGSCAKTVATSLAFRPVRQTPGVRSLLARHGIK